MPKRILSWQSKLNKFLRSYLLSAFNVPHFSTKTESAIILRMAKSWRKTNRDLFFLYHICFLHLFTCTFLFQEYIEMEVKTYPIIFEGCLKDARHRYKYFFLRATNFYCKYHPNSGQSKMFQTSLSPYQVFH